MVVFPPAPDERLTRELLVRIRGGDDGAWETLYRKYHDELLFTVRTQLGSKLRSVLESEDVLQSVALEAFRALPDFEPRGDGSLRRFLHTLVVNKIRDRADTWKAQKRDRAREGGDSVLARVPDRGGEASCYFDEAYVKLEGCLMQLPDDMREVVVLRKLEGFSSKEVAERTERSDAAVRKLFSRGLARLAALMGAPGNGEP